LQWQAVPESSSLHRCGFEHASKHRREIADIGHSWLLKPPNLGEFPRLEAEARFHSPLIARWCQS
jgi:hypothetical protein